MKIIALLRQDLSLPSTSATPARIVPDSAMVLPGRPVFVPDMGRGWVGQPVLALRLGRLGRDIAPKFASRYVDAATVALWLRLPEEDAELSAGLLDGLDASLAAGTWIPAGELTAPSVPVSTPCAEISVELRAEIESAVPAVSRYMTLKMGDIILAGPAGPPLELSAGSRVTASLAGREVLSVKIL